MRSIPPIKGLLLIVALTWSASVSAASVAQIALDKSESGDWTVGYSFSHAVTRIAFARNPNNARVRRWVPKSEQFELISADGQEFITRVDGASFNRVMLGLTSTYTHLPKDYAPFSPYSDGGTLIHSGRFFACAEQYDGSENQWLISLTVPDDEHIVVNGEVSKSSASWTDSNSGQNVYVGKQLPVETPSVIAVVDEGLPERIQDSLSTNIPRLMTYFESKLGRLHGDRKPTLLASYANVEGQSTQGGVLPGQIFMHWNVNNLHQIADGDGFVLQTLWFFAHEVAHLYQSGKSGQMFLDSHEAWVHEGHADLLAAKALGDLFEDSDDYIDQRFQSAANQCFEGLNAISLADAAAEGKFYLHYACGLLLHDAIDRHAQLAGSNTFEIWQQFAGDVDAGKERNLELFFFSVEKHAPSLDTDVVRRISAEKVEQPERVFKELLPPITD